MALVKRIDFGNALGVKDGTIRSKISRKQLCCNKKGLIDTENRLNYAYLLEINGGNQDVFADFDLNSKTNVQRKVNSTTKPPKNILQSLKTPPESTVVNSKSKTIIPDKISKKLPLENLPEEESQEDKKRRIQEAKERKQLLDYDMRKKKADAEFREFEAEHKRMQLEKLAGNTLPLDLVKKLFQINFQSVFVQMYSSVENMVGITVEELGGTRADNVRIINTLKAEFKKIVENCKDNSGREIEIAVNEYSDVRSRGERKT